MRVQGHLVHKNPAPPQERCRTIGIVLLYGPRWVLFLISEEPLYPL